MAVEAVEMEMEAVEATATPEMPVALPVVEARPPPCQPPEIVRLLQLCATRSSVEAIERAVECARQAGSASDASVPPSSREASCSEGCSCDEGVIS